MIKIIFEVNEDFVRENASFETIANKIGSGDEKSSLKRFLDTVCFRALACQIDEGKTEFVVSADKLDYKSKELYKNQLAPICMLASLSETDNVKTESKD